MAVLYQAYGVGTNAPSKFGIVVLSRMQFPGGCPALMQSKKFLDQSSADSFLAPREELGAAVRSLNCH